MTSESTAPYPLPSDTVNWLSDNEFVIAGTSFPMTIDQHAMHGVETSDNRFLLAKNRVLVEDLLKWASVERPKNVVEIGIFKGGSIALYTLVFQPTKLVGIEYEPARVAPLDAFIRERGLEGSVRLHYGVDQGDRPQMREIVDSEFGGNALDLVVDDGSHRYEKTKSSFETLFPLVRPGGTYIVEDWGWAHWPGRVWQESEAFPATEPSLTTLLLEVCMLAASQRDIVSRVTVESSLFRVTRGHGHVESGFTLGTHYLNRGKPLSLI